MSVDFELVCKKHKARCDISTDGMSGPMFNCDKALPFFCVTHQLCDIRIMSEHELDNKEYDKYTVWTNENRRELLDYDITIGV
jgi:hypothetical protein